MEVSTQFNKRTEKPRRAADVEANITSNHRSALPLFARTQSHSLVRTHKPHTASLNPNSPPAQRHRLSFRFGFCVSILPSHTLVFTCRQTQNTHGVSCSRGRVLSRPLGAVIESSIGSAIHLPHGVMNTPLPRGVRSILNSLPRARRLYYEHEDLLEVIYGRVLASKKRKVSGCLAFNASMPCACNVKHAFMLHRLIVSANKIKLK